MDVWGHTAIWGCMDAPHKPLYACQLKELNISLVKTKFLHVKSWKIIRELPDHTGN